MSEATQCQDLEGLINSVFDAIRSKDVNGFLSLFAEDAVLIDPHFLVPRMEGKLEIATAMTKAFSGMEAFGYTINSLFEAKSGRSAAVETLTHHTMRRGIRLNFPQVFVFDFEGASIKRMQAYEPYGPHGLLGFGMALGRILQRVLGKSRKNRRPVSPLVFGSRGHS